jgi:rubrerythrin
MGKEKQKPDFIRGIEDSRRAEEKQMQFYSQMKGVLHNDRVARLFGFLSREKKLQKRILEKNKKSLEEKNEWTIPDYDWGDMKSAIQEAGMLREEKLRRDAGDIEVISSAMGREGEAAGFYESMSEKLRGDGNDFFRRLSEREQMHHDLLVEILDSIKSTGSGEGQGNG